MKNKILSKAYGGVTEARHRLYGLGLPRQWKVITSTLLLLFTLAIGNVWAADVVHTYEFKNYNSTKIPTVSSANTKNNVTTGHSFTVSPAEDNTVNTTFYYGAGTTSTTVKTAAYNSSDGVKYTGCGYFVFVLSQSANVKITTKTISTTWGVDAVSDGVYTWSNYASVVSGTYATLNNNAETDLGTLSAGRYKFYYNSNSSWSVKKLVITYAASNVAPEITAPTTDQSAVYTVGDAITALSVTATGTPTPTYQWYYNSSASTEGATSLGSSAQTASYTPSNAAASDLYYYCVATNSEGSDQSPYFHVTVNAAVATAPSFTSPASEPAVAEYSVGDAISALEVVAAGYPAPTLQWYSNSSKSTEGATLITGAESASYTPSNAAVSDLYFYCVATNASGTAQSEYFHVTVAPVSYCAELVPATSGDAPAAGDAISLTTATGGSIKALTADLSYDANGLLFGNNSSTKAEVTLTHLMQVGTVITATIYNASDNKARGLKLLNNSGTSKATWTKTMIGDHVETYTVVAGDGLAGSNVFQLQRSENAYLKDLKVSNCGAEVFALSSAVSVAGKGTVTLSKSFVEAGGSATATYSEIDAAYEFDGWEITSGDATIADPTAATAAITMGTTASTITLKLKAAEVKYLVTYYDGEESMGTELVLKDGHPTATGIATRKLGYTFQGWSLTNGGAVKALSEISVTEAMPLYAVYAPVVCPTKGTVFSMSVTDATATEYNENNAFGLEIGATYTLGIAYSGSKNTTKRVGVIDANGEYSFTNSGDVAVKVALDCALAEGDVISFTSTSSKELKIQKVVGTNLYTTSGKKFTIPAESPLIGESVFYLMRDNSGSTFKTITVSRPYTVSFNLNGQTATAIPDQKIIAGGKVTKPADPVVVGQAFGGWYKVAACTAGNEWDFANDVVSDDVELFAKWTALPKMTLNAGTGTGDEVVSYPTVGSAVTVPGCPAGFEKTGYIFAGWVYSPSVTVEAGSFTMPNENLTLTAQWVDASSVARIGSTYYGTFADAIAAVTDGQTIQLLQNCAFATAWTIAGKTVTLDMNGKNLTGPATGDAIDINTDGKLILKDDAATEDPTINGSNEVTYAGGKLTGKWPINVNAGGEFVMNGGWIVAGEAAAWVGYTGKVTINNGVLEAMDNAVVMAPGNAGKGGYTIDIKGGILLGHITSSGYASACVYHPNTGVLNISGGTLVSTNGPAVVVRAGESHITGGTIISQGGGGKVGDASAAVPAVGVVYDFKANYPGEDINAAITAGNITSVAAIYASATPTTAEINAVNISGGTFSSPVAEALCAPSYVPETKANGKYGVIYPAQSIDFMAIIEAEGTGDEGKAELDAQLSSKHYDIDGTLNNDRLEAGGFKVKKTGLTISFSVEKEKVVEITTGHISGASIKVDDVAAVAMEGDKKHTYYSDDAQAFLITMTAAGNAYNIFKSINIRDPFTVTFEAHGDADPAALQGKPSVILPSATNGTKSLTGWFTEETGGTKIGDATDEYTPTANITLHAQWEDISTDARLASITLDPSTGVLSPAFDPEVVNYTYTMPYGTADVPTITGATKANPAAKDPVIDAQAAAWGETAHVHGVAASDDTKDYYVQMLRAPKDGICIIKSTPTSGTDAAVDGIYQGNAYFKGKAENKKLNSKYDYVAVELADGYTFQAGDKVVLNQTVAVAGDDITKFYVFTEVPADGKSYVTVNNAAPVQGDNWFDMPAELVGQSALYIGRIDAKCNPTLGYLAVYRPLPPVLNKVTVNGVEGKPNALKEVVIEVAASTTQSELEAIAYDWVSNSDAWTAAHTPVATNTWEFGVANTVTLTDKDGDESVYTITVNKATASTSVELATLTVDGNAITLVPGQAVYSYEYPYGTAETPAPEVAATAADNAEVGTITQAATKNGTATFTVTAEDGITYRDYTINISVSRVPAVAIYDGSTMTNITTKTGSDPTGLSWSMGSNVAATGDNIAGTWQGKNYTHAVKGFKANANANNLVSFVVPEDYMAKVRLVGSTNSSGSERKMFIAKEATNDASKAIENYVITSSTYDAQGFVTDFMLPGTYYLGSTDSYRLFEFSVQLYPIDYSRATTEGRYGTICLPNGGIMVGATLYEVAYYGATSEKIFFDEILNGTMVAGVPYIYLPNEGADKLAVFYTDEANESAKSANGLVGYIGASENTSDALPVPHNDGNYILNNNQYREVVSANSAYILSHRAYIHLAGITPSEPALAPGRRRISMSVYSEQVATGIENTGFESEAPRKVLINGELYIIRGEKMYDAKGQLVK